MCACVYAYHDRRVLADLSTSSDGSVGVHREAGHVVGVAAEEPLLVVVHVHHHHQGRGWKDDPFLVQKNYVFIVSNTSMPVRIAFIAEYML